jgi:hypothetical protein
MDSWEETSAVKRQFVCRSSRLSPLTCTCFLATNQAHPCSHTQHGVLTVNRLRRL